jgi:CheY-like chemotaxis protein
MFFTKTLKSYKTVQSIRDRGSMKFTAPLKLTAREKIPIAVIDDQPFAAMNNLRNLGYKISEIGDLKSVTEVSPFSIILCDLMGVGLNFDSSAQGSSIMKEIKRNYPAILVAAYTGSAQDSDLVRRAKRNADRFIPKDAEIETWSEELDKLIEQASDPVEIWLRTRRSLVDEKMDTKKLLIAEDAYVESVLTNDANFQSLRDFVDKETGEDSVRSIINSLIASGIFKVLLG